MELFKQEMELFLPLPVLWSKNFFNKNFLISTQEFKIDFQNRKRNYLNRKWNHFRPSDQKLLLQDVSHFSKGVSNWLSNLSILSLLPILSFLNLSYLFAAYGGSSLFNIDPAELYKINN